MSCSRERSPCWAAVGPAALVEVLAPLRDEHLHDGQARLIARDDNTPLQQIVDELGGDGTLLVIEDPAEPSLRGTYARPLLESRDGTEVVLGWLRLDEPQLTAYVHRAVALLRRPAQPALPIALLGPRERRYVDLLDQLARAAESTTGLVPFHWGAERLARHRLAAALRQGASAAIYVGHGNRRGWFSYGGVSADVLTDGSPPAVDETIGVLFSLACRTAEAPTSTVDGSGARRRSLAEDIVRCGIASAVVGAAGDPFHEDNRVLAAALIRAMSFGERTCADVVRASRAEGACLDGYAIIGDPAMRVAAAPGAVERCAAVFAPAPDALLHASGVTL